MELRANKPLRNYGVYLLGDKTLVLFKRSDVLSFLFSERSWAYRGAVDYRVSHGTIYQHGCKTGCTDEDLLDTGMTAKPPTLATLRDMGTFDVY